MGTIRAIRHKSAWRNKRAKRGIAKAHVPSWTTKDRGSKGRVPMHKRWSKRIHRKPSHKIVGYGIDLPMQKRRSLLRKEVKQRAGYGAARFKSLGKMKEPALSTKRTLQQVVNVNPSRKSDRIMRKDIKFLEKRYKV
jgi:hypothetical protein